MNNNNQISETKEFVKDLVGSTVEVGTSLVIENLPEFGAEVAGIIGNEAIGATIQILTGGLLGAVAPSLLGVKMSFQQKRFERNMIKMVTSLREKQEIIEQRMSQLNPEVQQKFISGPYRDVLLDNIISENQEQKVQDNINGYINLMGVENPNDDIVFTFFHTLSQMNELDIRILRLYRPTYEMTEDSQESFIDVLRDEDIDQSQYDFIREKLCRLGMLDSKNQEKRDENLEILGEKLTELIKQLYAKKSKEVKVPKIKRISRSESYRITRLGRQYLTFIDDPQ